MIGAYPQAVSGVDGEVDHDIGGSGHFLVPVGGERLAYQSGAVGAVVDAVVGVVFAEGQHIVVVQGFVTHYNL